MKATATSALQRRRLEGGRRRMAGAAVLELVLVALPLCLLLVGGAEFGRAIYTHNTLNKAVRDAARHLSLHGPGDATVRAEARCLAVFGREDCTGTPLATGLAGGQVTVCDALSCAADHAAQPLGTGVVNLVSVSVTGYQFQSVLAWIVPTMTFRSVSATMRGAS